MVKAFNAYAYLLLAYFLYIDSYMEYLGCRFQLLKPHATEGNEHLGLDSDSELYTWKQVNVGDPADKELLEDIWAWEGNFGGKFKDTYCPDGKIFR